METEKSINLMENCGGKTVNQSIRPDSTQINQSISIHSFIFIQRSFSFSMHAHTGLSINPAINKSLLDTSIERPSVLVKNCGGKTVQHIISYNDENENVKIES